MMISVEMNVLFQFLSQSQLAALPAGTEVDPPYVTEYALACIKFPIDPEERVEAVRQFSYETLNKRLFLNVEIRGSPSHVTLVDPNTNTDMGKVSPMSILM